MNLDEFLDGGFEASRADDASGSGDFEDVSDEDISGLEAGSDEEMDGVGSDGEGAGALPPATRRPCCSAGAGSPGLVRGAPRRCTRRGLLDPSPSGSRAAAPPG
jgi:hypothetical protein